MVEVLRRLVIAGPGRVALCQTVVNGPNRPVRRARDVVQLIPSDRHRYPRSLPRPRRPGAYGGGAEPVAQIVDVDLADPIGWTALGHETFGQGLCNVFHDRLGKCLDGDPGFCRSKVEMITLINAN